MLSDQEAANCKRAKQNLENSYMKKEKRKETYIALEQLNFCWDVKEVEGFRIMWKEGISIIDISSYFNRSQEEVALLVMDQSLSGMIKERKGGLLGWINAEEL